VVTADDVAAIFLCLSGVAIFALTWWADREHRRIAERHERQDRDARAHTIGIPLPYVVPPRTQKGGPPKGTTKTSM
jgi:hypothetical protein